MAKKKKSIPLTAENLSFCEDGVTYVLLYYFPSAMTVEVATYENGKKTGVRTLPFAHLPKALKKQINPL
ncbi:MAG: hypothetical protein PHI89_01505 [Thiovulaceae bacterium]|nr:hypothetical protein [Sulfurimonadaceae bacterium]MDD3816745.1 hypothetical protein [Sulfurimonadaceae bacterium]